MAKLQLAGRVALSARMSIFLFPRGMTAGAHGPLLQKTKDALPIHRCLFQPTAYSDGAL